jgi:thioredoxin-dependent peroxiredoxin
MFAIRSVSSLLVGGLLVGSLFALSLAPDPAAAQDVVLDVGDRAPVFQGLADDGTTWHSRNVVGRQILVVYFYPAAMTDGCTKQACSFRDNRSRLQEMGVEVVGVSGDDLDGLRAFKGSNRLNFPLLSDTEGDIARAFGVPLRGGGTITRTVDGKEVQLTRGVTAARWTFIIGRDGRIAYKDTQVDPAGDGDAVIAALRRIRRGG